MQPARAAFKEATGLLTGLATVLPAHPYPLQPTGETCQGLILPCDPPKKEAPPQEFGTHLAGRPPAGAAAARVSGNCESAGGWGFSSHLLLGEKQPDFSF